MTEKFATILCYWGGFICDGHEEGVTYDKAPNKAIKVHYGIQYNELVRQIHLDMSIDKQRHHIKIVGRYPSVVGKVMKYSRIPIEGNDDLSIMFDVLSQHPELSNIDLYLEIQHNEPQQDGDVACRTQESILLEERSIHANVLSDMIQNEDFGIISQIALVNNEFDAQELLEDDEIVDEGDAEELDNYSQATEVPSNFTNLEGMEMTTTGNWKVLFKAFHQQL